MANKKGLVANLVKLPSKQEDEHVEENNFKENNFVESSMEEMKKNIFTRLYNEPLRKQRRGSDTPISRKKYLEQLEEAECKFKPQLTKKTQKLAEEGKNRSKFEKVDMLLYEDALKRNQKQKKIEEDVIYRFYITKN